MIFDTDIFILSDFRFTTLPLTETIGHRATLYIEKYSLSCGMRTGDAIIAAAAIENNLSLLSGNLKHFKMIPELKLITFFRNLGSFPINTSQNTPHAPNP